MNELDGPPEVDPPLPAGPPASPARSPAPASPLPPAPASPPSLGPSGQAPVDAAVAELARAERLTPDQQIEMYESVHRALQDTLRSIEQS
jgi:hypothetical protein